MTEWFDNHDDAGYLTSPGQRGPAAASIRRLFERAAHARSVGQHDRADELLCEAHALDGATRQYQWAIADARRRVDDLHRTVIRFWNDLADDRTLHDLADDAGVLLALYEDLDRAESRLLTLECARP